MKILETPLEKLRSAEYNPRRIPNSELEKLIASIRQFGFVEPVVANHKGIIIGGHQRFEAAKKLGLKTIPVFYIKLPRHKEKLLNLALNRIRGTWDEDKLAEILSDLQKELPAAEIELSGFEQSEITAILEGAGLIPNYEDKFNLKKMPPENYKPKSRKGETYKLGDHRLMCGDTTDPAQLKELLKNNKVDMVFTDPPYNVDYLHGDRFTKIKNDNQNEERYVEFCETFIRLMAENLKPGGVFYICSGYSNYPVLVYSILNNGLEFSCPIIWIKNVDINGWSDYRPKNEMVLKGKNKKKKREKAQPILYGWNKGKHFFNSIAMEADVWNFKKRPPGMMIHPTQKPVALIVKAIGHSTRKTGEIILDLFGGSGSTLMAAEETGRICYMMELDPANCDKIRNRFEAATT